MSLYFYLKLPFNTPKEAVERAYKKFLVANDPDRSKKDTLAEYLNIQREYEKYKLNLLDDNFYVSCFPNELNSFSCRCGSKFILENLEKNKIECESCSCYVIVEKEPGSLK